MSLPVENGFSKKAHRNKMTRIIISHPNIRSYHNRVNRIEGVILRVNTHLHLVFNNLLAAEKYQPSAGIGTSAFHNFTLSRQKIE
jgi:hypothetical protein